MPQRVNFNHEPDEAIAVAAAAIRAGGVVVFPTETFYGLAVDPTNAKALERLAAIKDRESQKPIPLIAADVQAAQRLGQVPPALAALCERFWPGPLTVALEPSQACSPRLLGQGTTVGVRVSSNPVAQALATAVGGLITSTSANLAGRRPVARLSDLDPALAPLVDVVVDGGTLTGGLASTVVCAQGDNVVVLRPGAINAGDLQQVLGRSPLMSA